MNIRSIIFILFLIIRLKTMVTAQTPESFFPHQVGNLWQYQWFEGPMWTERIHKDSLAADGSVFLFYNNHYEPRYRMDTLFNVYQNPLSSNDHLYKLDADSGEAWIWFSTGFTNWYGWVARIDTGMVFNKLTPIKVIRFGPNHPDSCGNFCLWYDEHHLANGFGLIYEWVEPGNVAFLLGCVVAGDTFGTVVSVAEDKQTLPSEFHLAQNYPNPFNPVTNIEFSIPYESFVRLTIYALLGREVSSLVNDCRSAGTYTVSFDGSNLASGVYMFQLRTDKNFITRKMILMR